MAGPDEFSEGKYGSLSGSSKATAHMKPQLQDINNWVVPYVTDKWEKVFVQLLGDKYHHVMATLRKDHQGNNEAGCIAMFEEWFQLCPNPTWNHLITALRSDSVRKINLAERLHQRIAELSAQSLVSPTQHVTPQQQHGGSHGPDQLVTNIKDSKEQYEEKQPAEATDNGRGGVHVNTISTSTTVNFSDCDDISKAFLRLMAEISKLLKKADFSILRRALLYQRRILGGVQLPDDLHKRVKVASDLDDLLDILADSKYLSCVDLRLLDALIVSSGIHEAEVLVYKYKEAIFPKKLSEIIDKLLPKGKEQKKAYTAKVGSKIQKEPEEMTVGDLLHYQTILESIIMDISEGSCVLEDLGTGCLEIHWLIPVYCRFHAYKSALNNRHKFCVIHLQYLHIEPYLPIYDPFTIQPTVLSTLLRLPKPSTPAEVIDHYYCFLLENLNGSVICQLMLGMKLLNKGDLIHYTKMYSEYQKNAFLMDHLLTVGTASIVEFCHLLQNIENQEEIGTMLVNDINLISNDNDHVARVNLPSHSFTIEEDDEEVSNACQPELFLAPKTVHLRFLNLASQLKHKLKDYNPRGFLEACHKLAASISDFKTIPLVPSEYLEDLNDADTSKIFDRLSVLWKWNNHYILRALLEACNCQDGIKMLDEFESQIDTNQPMELFPIPPPSAKMVPSSSSAYTVLFIKRTHNRGELVPLHYISDTVKIMVEKFGISPHALQLLAAQATNPLTLYWLILKSVVPLIHSGVNKYLNFIKENWFTEIVIYPSTVLFTANNLELGPFALLGSQPYLEKRYQHIESLEVDQSAKDLEVDQLKSNIDDLNNSVEQLTSRLSTLQSEYDTKLKALDDIQSKYDTVVERYSELLEQRNVSETFTQYSVPDSLEYDIEEWHQHAESLEADQSAKVLEVDQYSVPDSLEYDIKEKKTVLHYGAIMGHVPLVQILISFGAEVNAVDKEKRTALHYGALNGHVSIVEILVNAGADVNAVDEEKNTALHFGAENSHVSVVEALIRLGANVNVEHEWTPLHAAARSGDVKIVEILIKSGADVGTDIDKWCPLHVAAKNGHLAVVEALLKSGAALGTDMVSKWTPVYVATKSGHAAVAETLIKFGANAGAAVIKKWAPLHVAVKHGYVSEVENLVKLGADVNAFSTDNWTPLLSAAKNGYVKVAETLIRLGADVHIGNMDKLTPLHAAARYGHIKVVEILINSGADVCATDLDKCTPIHEAAENGHNEVVKTLFEFKADINAVTVNQQSSLHLAAKNGHLAVVGTLIQLGANMEIVTKDKCTPLHLASQNGHVQVVDTLIKSGANINAITVEKQSPLHIAAGNGHDSIVKVLIESKADINAVAKRSWTSLHFAVQKCHISVIEMLIRSGVDVNAVDINKSTSLHLAVENNHVDTVELLIKSNAAVDTKNKVCAFN